MLRLIIFNEANGVLGEHRAELAPASGTRETADGTATLHIENVFTSGRYRIVGELHARYEEETVIADSDVVEFDNLGTPVTGNVRLNVRETPVVSNATDQA